MFDSLIVSVRQSVIVCVFTIFLLTIIIVIVCTGTSGVGKSTIFKQFKILNKKLFSVAEKKSYVPIIHKNVLEVFRGLCNVCKEMKIPYQNTHCQVFFITEQLLSIYVCALSICVSVCCVSVCECDL